MSGAGDRRNLRELQARLSREPDNLGLRVLVATALREAGSRGEAIELYRSVAATYRDQGRYQQALAVCRSLLALAPADVGCQALLAELEASARAGSEGEHATPLPPPLAHHDAFPTSSVRYQEPIDPESIADADLIDDSDTRPSTGRLARGLITAVGASTGTATLDDDLATELETRQRVRVSAAELDKLGEPPRPPSASGDEEIDAEDEADSIDAPLRAVRASAAATRRPASRPGTDNEPTQAKGARDFADEQTQPRDHPDARRDPLAGAFFAPLPADKRREVLAKFKPRGYAAGATVIRQGETGHSLFVIARGKLELRVDRATGSRIVLGTLGAGEFVGEGSLLARGPAQMQVVAVGACELLELAPTEFYAVAAANTALWAALKALAEHRRRQLDGRLRSPTVI